ncbi:glycosyltransferase [Alkalicoccus daliensis]|uniref:Glycosyltransferase involved in cell wall bisynthesis n=1 Tax=Alkalicoccus daliensis TaxID=745820 RepID=A0A1H0GJI3_9BACI|nr:glycosyltransferase [Alkalicoccus daliensis]SDO06881.1 Glycosyltransferase involved in cell wall bisynthesis [Alkalicoccus daliensis]
MSKQKKVVHISTLHHPLDPRIYYKQCRSLQQAGFDVTLIAPASADVKEELEVTFAPLKKHRNRWKGLLFGTVQAYFRAKKEKADVYHFHDPELLIVGWLLKNKSNHVIYDIHEDYETGIVQRNYFNAPIRRLIAKVYKLIEKKCTRNMELILAEKYYQEKYPQGICVLNYPLLNGTLLEKEREFKDASQLLYTGNVTKDRGAVQHAKLPGIDKDISVHLFGKCPGNLAEEMKQAAGTAADRMFIHGIDHYVPKTEIDHAYEQKNWLAGIALFPPTEHYMKKELTKFFEYMTAGLPIVCSDFPKWSEFMKEYQCGLSVNPDDADEIRGALSFLKENPQQAKEMGENGRRAVLEHLNWEKEEEKLLQLYEQLVHK